MIRETSNKLNENHNELDHYHSVEFLIEGVDLPYQFRIWDFTSDYIRVLVRDDSGVLPLLKEGDVHKMKYYSTKSVYPSENIKTAIRRVTKENQGRLKGHYLIGLEAMDSL